MFALAHLALHLLPGAWLALIAFKENTDRDRKLWSSVYHGAMWLGLAAFTQPIATIIERIVVLMLGDNGFFTLPDPYFAMSLSLAIHSLCFMLGLIVQQAQRGDYGMSE